MPGLVRKFRALQLLFRTLGPLNTLRYKFQRLRMRVRAASKPLAYRVPGSPHPVWVRPGTSDMDVFHHTFVHQQYACLGEVADPRLIIDGGANVGYSAVWFLIRYPAAKVIAVEPDPANADLLERNLKPYGDRATVVRSALWSRPAGLVVRPGGDGRAWAWTVRESAPWETPDLTATEIGVLLAAAGEPRISILKMRVEGAEEHIFGDADPAWLARTDAVVIELHNPDCRRAFMKAVAGHPFAVSEADDLTICRRAA